VGELERTLLVLRAAGLPPKLGDRNLLAALVGKQRADGSFGTVNHTAFGLLALRAGGRNTRSTEVRKAVRFLLRVQNKDGGFGFSKSAASDVDDTGAVMQAIAAGGRKRSAVVDRAVRYLRKVQRPDGGFGQMATSDSNAQSTAFAVQGLAAAGRNPRKLKRARTPIEYLKSLQASDGSVRYSRTSEQTPVWVTAQALNALEVKPYPLPPAPRQQARAVAVAASTTPAPKARSKQKPAPRARSKAKAAHRTKAGAVAEPAAKSNEVQVRPVAQTTTTTDSPVTTSGDGEGSYWPFVFAALLGIVVLIGLRLAWRRD
jgi:hypothetical protein